MVGSQGQFDGLLPSLAPFGAKELEVSGLAGPLSSPEKWPGSVLWLVSANALLHIAQSRLSKEVQLLSLEDSAPDMLFDALTLAEQGKAQLLLSSAGPFDLFSHPLPDLSSRLAGIAQITLDAPSVTQSLDILHYYLSTGSLEIESGVAGAALALLPRRWDGPYLFAEALNKAAGVKKRLPRPQIIALAQQLADDLGGG